MWRASVEGGEKNTTQPEICVEQGDDELECTFRNAIIPYTHDNTNFCDIKAGTVVNLEFDILG